MSDSSLNHAQPGDEGAPLPDQASQTSPAKPPVAGAPGIGAQLAAQREAHGWTVEQVASQLNLAVRQIQALESDNFEALPGIAIVRGFIRAYAKLLRIDAAPLIAMLAVDAAPPQIESLHSRKPLTAPFSDARHLPPNGARKLPSVSMMLAAGIAVVAILAFAVYRFGWIPMHATSPAEAGAAATSGEQAAGSAPPAVAGAVPDAKEASATAAPATPSAAQPASDNGPAAQAANAAPPAPTAPATTNAQVPATAQAAVATTAPAEKPAAPEPGQNTLTLKFRDASWIEIRRTGEAKPGTSGILMSHIARAGTMETFEVTEPVAVTIGNATGIEATFRGQPLDIKPGPKTNVARLNLK